MHAPGKIFVKTYLKANRDTLFPNNLLTVIIFFQSKKFTACKIKDEKEETIFT